MIRRQPLLLRERVLPQECQSATSTPVPASRVTGSINALIFEITPSFQNGWLAGRLQNFPAMNSLSTSTRLQRDGTLASGPHIFNGLPITGFALRTFENGTLDATRARARATTAAHSRSSNKRQLTPFD
jgi:hypothetical protein